MKRSDGSPLSALRKFCTEKDCRYMVLAVFVVLFASLSQYAILNMTPYASGTDGYYYAYQIKSFHENGIFSAPESSLSLYFLYMFSMFSDDYVLTSKVAVAVLKGLFAAAMYMTGKNINGKACGIIAAVISSSSVFINFFTTEYVKALGGIVLFTFFLNSLVVLYKKRTAINSLYAAVFFIASVVSHKAICVFSVIMVLPYIMLRLNKRISGVLFLLLTSVLILTAVLIPNSLHYLDFLRFNSYFSLHPKFLPLEFLHSISPGPLTYVEIFTWFVLTVIAIWKVAESKSPYKLFLFPLFTVLIICMNPFVDYHSSDMSFRLFIFMFIPSTVFICMLLANRGFLSTLLTTLFLLPVGLKNTYYIYKIHNHNYELYSDIIPLIDIPDNSLLIVHQGFDYFYWYKTGKKAFHFMPEPKHFNRPLYRLAFGVRKDLFEKYGGPSVHPKYLPGFYTLLKENEWSSFLENVPGEEKKTFMNWRNPNTYRNDFLLRNQKFRRK